MCRTKVELSKKEMELVSSAEFILTKNSVIEKVYKLFGEMNEIYKSILNDHVIPDDVLKASPKIFKGENYEGLPYVMLDYPRLFSKQDVFAVRSFFWWGNFFSITLHLAGRYAEMFKHNIYKNLAGDEFFICVNDDAWQHHFNNNNFKCLNEVDINEVLRKPFIKIAAKISLQEWSNAELFFEKFYVKLLQLLK